MATHDPVEPGFGPVPEANMPGHHAEVDQDKPTGPPPRPRSVVEAEAQAEADAAEERTDAVDEQRATVGEADARPDGGEPEERTDDAAPAHVARTDIGAADADADGEGGVEPDAAAASAAPASADDAVPAALAAVANGWTEIAEVAVEGSVAGSEIVAELASAALTGSATAPVPGSESDASTTRDAETSGSAGDASAGDVPGAPWGSTSEPASDPLTGGAADAAPRRWPFAAGGMLALFVRSAVLDERLAHVEIAGGTLTARFGPWVLTTPLSNVRDVEVTGPYAPWKVLGPPHVSLVDRGLTFATTTERGACITFHEPVAAVDPFGWLRHPALTVTVADPESLAEALRR